MSENGVPFKMTYKKRRLITALLATRTEGEAAEMAGLSLRTVSRCLAQPIFQDELREASQAAGRKLVDESMRRLTEGQKKALDVLEDVMEIGKENERRQAAVSWITIWREIREQQDFEDRLSRLEKELTP